MVEASKLVEYFRLACDDILTRGTIDARRKYELRPGQRQGYEALKVHLDREDLADSEKLIGAFKMTVGLGKTGFFGALTDRVLQRAKADGHKLRVVIVAPKIELLNQTYKELTTFFPYLKDKVGIYGGDWPEKDKIDIYGGDLRKAGKPRRESDKDVTIISIPSWENLLDAGQLNADTAHIHFADEGHRLTSAAREKRLEELLAHAVRFAFTATESFSEEKTVLNSHSRLIFEKGLVESVRDGESAAYIRAQHHVIRVDPPKPGETFDSQLVRQMGFINFVREVLQSGVDPNTGERFGFDEVTGDRLTDNQIGIYVGNTAQADKCAEVLNASSDLKKVAAQHNAEEFAVSIHTNGINTKQQGDLKEDYETGKRRALAGDELFKEGYNHQPMKTVIVMQTGSPLDLEQIIGRGARQWWNEEKGRYEGLTVISTTVYVGVDPENPKDRESVEKAAKADERARLEALANSASAVDILEGNVQVFWPAARRFKELADKAEPSRSSGATLRAFDGIQVTSYTTLEAVWTIHAEREKAREAFVPKDNLTEEQIIGWIKATKEKTNKYPFVNDRLVWSQGASGDFILIVDETWDSIDHSIKNGLRGLVDSNGKPLATSIFDFRRKNGLIEPHEHYNNALNKDILIKWIKDTREKTGKYPTVADQIVWNKKPDGQFEVVDSENWTALNAAVAKGNRGLSDKGRVPFAKSLLDFRNKYELIDNLSTDMIQKWIEDTEKKTGKYPGKGAKEVWCQKSDGSFELVDETWSSINRAFKEGKRGLVKADGSLIAASLADFRKIRMLKKQDLNEMQIVEWFNATKEKTGFYPSHITEIIWSKTLNGRFEIVDGIAGWSVAQALKGKTRSVIASDGSKVILSLSNFKKKHNLIDNNAFVSSRKVRAVRPKPSRKPKSLDAH